MSETTLKRSLVRPSFLRWSIVVFVLLVPFVVHAVWDYVETRRLKTQLNAIAQRGEPLRAGPYPDLRSEASATADRYYRAAAALASDVSTVLATDLSRRVFEAKENGAWPADVIDQLRPVLDRYQDALSYADRAAPLQFQGFRGSYSLRTSELMGLSRLCAWRAVVRAMDGDGQASVDSLYSQARLVDPLGAPWWGSVALSDLQLVLSRTRAPREALVRLRDALVDLDGGDEALKKGLMEVRAMLIDDPEKNPLKPSGSRHAVDVLQRPWVAHKLNGSLQSLSILISAANGPWPEQMDRVKAAVPPAARPPNTTTWSDLAGQDAGLVAQSLATTRVSRLVVAVEAYRRDHREDVPATPESLVPGYLAAIPLDPYTGHVLVMKKDDVGYTIYSLGANRRDDGGDVAPLKPVPPQRSMYPSGPDLGVRIPYR